MPRTPPTFTQADVARAIRAAKAEGWEVVRIRLPTGASIDIERKAELDTPPTEVPTIQTGQVADDDEEILL